MQRALLLLNPHWFSPALTTVGAAVSHLTHGGGSYNQCCKFKASERQRYEEVLHQYMQDHKRHHQDNTYETEVNMYVPQPDDGIVKAALLDNLVGLLYDRTMGKSVDYSALRRLQGHLLRLGKAVPIIEINMEWAKSLRKWDSQRQSPLNLIESPYSMHIVT